MIAYTALETFIPPWDPENEIVTLDGLLCPAIFRGPPTEEGWNYLVLHDIPKTFFDDLDYLLGQVEDETEYQILAVVREPTQSDVLGFTDERFDFKGYDLVEDETGISALTNCGGFPLAFSDGELSECGLVPDFENAYRIRDLLKQQYPDEHHANCAVWAIWRMREEEA